MSRTLYVSDLDGTLLGDDSKLSPTTVHLLNHLIDDLGVLFTVATARTPATVEPLMREVHAQLPFIVIGGAALWDSRRQDYHAVRAISPDDISRIADVFERHGLHPFIYRRHGALLHTHHSGAMSDQEQQFVLQRQGLPLKRFFLNDTDYRHSPDEALLMFGLNRYSVLKVVADEVRQAAHCEVRVYHDNQDPQVGYLEICRAETTKARAIGRLAQQVEADRVVVFGDNRNDINMMQAATWSVAVDNAFDEVKAAANEIIGANTADAVPRWILDDIMRSGMAH